jgi:3-oxoacyl-[acyl-carrier-protein] synthase II
MSDAVLITGVGAVTPLGIGANTLLERWCEGERGFEDGVGRCDAFDPTDFLSVKEARRSDRFVQLAILACEEALEQAGWRPEIPFDPYRVACVIGTGIGGIDTLERQHDIYRERGPAACSPLGIPLLMSNAAAAALAMRHGFHGYGSAVVSACAAGADAIAAGVRLIRAGDADAVIAGGAESAISPFVQAAFDSMGAMSKTGNSLPFDARRDGFVLGEGSGVLVLERESSARERGAPALARITGIGTSSDAFHLTAPDPEGGPAAQAIQRAIADAGIAPGEVDYVNAHGTGTPLNDRAETQALKDSLGKRAHEIPVSSTKSAIGHLLGAAGAVEAIAMALSLRAQSAPPTLGYEVPDPDLDLDYVADGPRPLPSLERPLVGISNSFGFGGHNVVLAFQAAA